MLWFNYFLLLLLLNSVLELNLITKIHSLSRDEFPPDFVFGSGTSAYQWEGAVDEDGRSPSIWDTFARAGKMHGATGDIACDGYHRYKEDVQLMVDVGLEAFRFSISWSRLIPNGRGPINPKGLQFYNNFINELISHGIQPHVTLHHSDLPQALEDEYGGFISRKIIKDFTAYADVCFREFGDRIKYWTTFNEANVFVIGGYDSGILPPSHCSSPFGFNCSIGNSSTEPYIATHHILLSHASAANLYKKNYQAKQQGFIGINLFSASHIPLTDSLTNQEATQRANDFYIGWYLNPLVFGDYPKTMKKNSGSRIPAFTSVESKFVKGSIDFVGVNFYNTLYVKDQPSSLKNEDRDFNADMAADLILFSNDTSGFPLTPWGLQGVLGYIKQHYGNPRIYIHENGQRTSRNSSTEDWPKVKYMHAYIGGLLDSIRNGSNLQGYFQWSFMDVFELLDGYESRYGLYYVDLDDPDLKRQPKLSAHWYSNFLKRKNNSSDATIMSLSSSNLLLSLDFVERS